MPRSSAGKYDAILPGLKPLPLERNEALDAVMAEIEDRDPLALAEGYKKLRKEKQDLNDKLYDVNLKIEAHERLLCESQVIQAHGWGMYGASEKTLRLPEGGSIRIERAPYGQVKDKEAYRLWCIANGYEHQLQLWPSTTQAVVKERLMHGEPEPDGVEIFSMDKVVYTPPSS